MVMDRLSNMTMDPTHNEPLIELVKTFLLQDSLRLEWKSKGVSPKASWTKYENGVLEIPPLDIDETTETFSRNIISFE